MKKLAWAFAIVLAVVIAGGLFFYRYPLWVADRVTRYHLWRAGVRSEYVIADGFRLHYFEAVPPKGMAETPLLLVHGLGARGEDWAPMIPALAAKGFHVYVPDLLGYGRSPHPDVSYSMAMQETVAVQFLQAIHQQRVDVGGWSMGGWVSMKLALDHPEIVDRLVLYDSAGIYFPPTFEKDLFTPNDSAGLQRLITILSPQKRTLPDFVTKAMLRKLHGNAWVVNRSMAAMANGHELLDFQLQNIQQPTLIVWGSVDELIPLSVGETMHAKIPHSVLNVVEGCGHLAPAECSKPVVESTVDFLRAEPPMQGGEKSFPVEK